MAKLDIGEVLSKIDSCDLDYFKSLSEEDQSGFTPYTVMQWIGSINDSLQVKYRANALEAVTGKWKDGGKEIAKQLVDTFNAMNKGVCLSVAKCAETKYDWYIMFSVKDQSTARELSDFIYSLTNLRENSISRDIDPDKYKNLLVDLNRFVNYDFWVLQKNKNMIYDLMCLASASTYGVNKPRSWLQLPKNVNDDILVRFFRKYFDEPTIRIGDIQNICNGINRDEFASMVEGSGYVDTVDISKYMASYDRISKN